MLGFSLLSGSGEWLSIDSTPLVDAIGNVSSETFAVEAVGVASVGFEIDGATTGSLTVALGWSDVVCDGVVVGAAVGTTGGGKRAEIVEYCDMSENDASMSNCMFRSNCRGKMK